MLYVVRHGKTEWKDKKITIGCMDGWNHKAFKLSEEGIKESEFLRDKFTNIDIDLIITSPLTRARETAYIINENKEVEIIKENKLVERNMGNYELRRYPSFEENNRIWDLTINSDENFIEPMQDFKDRVFKCMDKIVEEYQDKDVLIVTHGGVTALIDCYFTNELYDGPITNKFLRNGEVKEYNLKKNKKMVLTPNNKINDQDRNF